MRGIRGAIKTWYCHNTIIKIQKSRFDKLKKMYYTKKKYFDYQTTIREKRQIFKKERHGSMLILFFV